VTAADRQRNHGAALSRHRRCAYHRPGDLGGLAFGGMGRGQQVKSRNYWPKTCHRQSTRKGPLAQTVNAPAPPGRVEPASIGPLETASPSCSHIQALKVTLHITQFEGGSALSSFRIQQLLPSLQAIHDKISGVSARFVHLVTSESCPRIPKKTSWRLADLW
jgi:hypothetical protein